MSELGSLPDDVKSSWQRFLETFEPLRPDLYRYCRYLTRSPWDAEDLVQDAMARGFVTLGTLFHELANPRAWMFRVASNLWIDRTRRQHRERELVAVAGSEGAPAVEPRASREAAGTLLSQLAPQERAAVVLKDVFELSLDDVATALSTSVGAVKAALHRGRGKLIEPAAAAAPAAGPGGEGAGPGVEPELERAPWRAPAPGALDAFCAAFNARDLPALTALLLDTAVTEIVGVVTEYGRDVPANPDTGSFFHSITPITTTETGGIDRRYLTDYVVSPPRCEIRMHRDQPILVLWYDHVGGPAVRTVWTIETQDDRIAHVRNYFFTPDVIAEVCRELAVPFRSNGYRYW
jgi:RNA polymerase sigma-70 factor (ECF subfamily)